MTSAPASKAEALDMAVDLMVKSEKISDREAYRKQVYLREEESTTGIGEGIAIPHGKCDAVKKPGLAAMVIKNGVEFEALDDEPVTLLFLIAAPNTEDNIHRDVLSKLSVMLMDEEFTESLRNASSVDEFMEIIDKADSEKKNIDERLADTGSAEGTQAKLLAVTSCPTGIAHTYMAAEGIEKAAKAKNCFVKIETRGSGGAKNVLTDQEIAEADCIIVAADAKVPIAFLIDGLSVDLSALPADQRANFGTITPVAALFKNIGGTAFGFMLPILAGFIAMAIGDRPALALGLVGGMMAANGKSGFLGALLAGFAAGYLILGLRKLCDKLPEALEKIAPVLIYPVVGILVMGLLMTFIVEPIMGGINTGLNNALTGMGSSSKIVFGTVLGGMMAIDMGGPFNKAAYVFGTAAIAAGNYDIMAAVMIGGMTPPCAITLATLLFKDKFTKEERDAGPTNFIMGLAIITEGASPFEASDPLRVLPSCIIGSAVAGAISMAFNCTLMAPHGGIFVFPVVGNAVMYLAALVVGTVISAVLLGLVKKKIA